uniref:Uncharacterized protein n=1 Tax=Rhizophora mucronata TaxID=61149 RepID=A0A2P2N0U3_RHIMU
MINKQYGRNQRVTTYARWYKGWQPTERINRTTPGRNQKEVMLWSNRGDQQTF